MKILLHSGTGTQVVRSVQASLAQGRAMLGQQAVLYPDGFGAAGQSDLFFASVPLIDMHPVAALRGLSDPVDLQDHGQRMRAALAQAIQRQRPAVLLLSIAEAAMWCDDATRLSALRAVLAEFSDDITAVLHLAAPADALADAIPAQVVMGRNTGIAAEADVARGGGRWWDMASAARHMAPQAGVPARHPMVQTASPCIDPDGVAQLWVQVFGADSVLAREFAAGAPKAADIATALADLGHLAARDMPVPVLVAHHRPSVPALRRALALNAALADHEARFGLIPWPVRDRLLTAVADTGKGLTGADLAALTQAIRPDAKPRKTAADLTADPGFDPAPLLVGVADEAAALRATAAEARKARLYAQGAKSTADAAARSKAPQPLTPAGTAILSDAAKGIYRSFAGGKYWPRNDGIVSFDEAADQPPYPVDTPPRTGTVIVGCMKNEGPYVLEWIAYHKAIGVDHFVIFTNDCSDATDDILMRLQDLGHVTHVNNNEWKGKSPQQAALNKALKLDVVKAAEWLIHIDVDEYINLRIGNGTLADLYAGMGDATNLSMTWRLFGNGGQDAIGDAGVIDRFTGCAPAYVPKPHTMWGFKSITRNIGAYEKLSCHRPNHLIPSQTAKVRWLNGNLQDFTDEVAEKGWRSSIRSIGYDAVQLNHYALRTRESFLIKRQRGRALHVDRSIGLNYWVRHDWNLWTDRTILRQVPRCRAMKALLLDDPELARLQVVALDWHHAKAAELRATDAFAELWDQTTQADLNDGERMAFAVAEDMES